LRRFYKVVWAGVVGASTLLGLYLGLTAVIDSHKRVPPAQLHGEFNVAVAQFSAQTASGDPVDTDVVDAFATSIADHLRTELRAEGQAGVDFDLLGPLATGSVDGASEAERTQRAGEIAEKLRADLVVYGEVHVGRDESTFVGDVFLPSSAITGADELPGSYRVVSAQAPGDIQTQPFARSELRREVVAKMRGLALFVLGVEAFSAGRLRRAETYFIRAVPFWREGQGRAVLNLFLGSIAGRQGQLDRAQQYYEAAIVADPTLARAQLGVAEVTFQKAKGTCEKGDIDGRGLREAANQFRHVGRMPAQPSLAHVTIKSRLDLARVHLCMSNAQFEDDWERARREFQSVVVQTQGSPEETLADLSSEAHGGLGFVALSDMGPAPRAAYVKEAIREFELARSLTSQRDRRAFYDERLGLAWCELGEGSAARAAFARAIAETPSAAMRDRYVREERTCEEQTSG
jgi:tetratricopeptide (TPR) repeat protein